MLVYFLQRHLIYYPTKRLSATPEKIGLQYESVYLNTDDSLRIHGWYVPSENPVGSLLFLHGNAGNISDRLELIRIYNRLSLNVFIIDYRGYGLSEGEPTEEGTYLDAEAAWKYLTDDRKVDPSEIVIFGRSLGGGVATWLATRHTPRALILESTFTSIPELAAEVYPYLPARWLARTQYNNLRNLKSIQCPLLLVHSCEDDVVPYDHARRLYEAASEPKTLLQIQCDHSLGFLRSKNYEPGVNAFLNEVFAKSPERVSVSWPD
ncbi:MAG: alpha/beta fold hydrolase [Chlorobiales bacterium]|nr:alpha/beta fold hydrolase [Chlorobiales bacterium]